MAKKHARILSKQIAYMWYSKTPKPIAINYHRLPWHTYAVTQRIMLTGDTGIIHRKVWSSPALEFYWSFKWSELQRRLLLGRVPLHILMILPKYFVYQGLNCEPNGIRVSIAEKDNRQQKGRYLSDLFTMTEEEAMHAQLRYDRCE